MPPAGTARLDRQIAFGRHAVSTKVAIVVDHPRHQYLPSRIDHRRMVGALIAAPMRSIRPSITSRSRSSEPPLVDQPGIGDQKRPARQS